MRKPIVRIGLLIVILLLAISFGSTGAQAAPNEKACWGQATQVFARMGVMGEHASQQPTPRLGLRNLARALYEQGVIEDDTLGLSIDVCR